jgi:hypothetical protein
MVFFNRKNLVIIPQCSTDLALLLVFPTIELEHPNPGARVDPADIGEILFKMAKRSKGM